MILLALLELQLVVLQHLVKTLALSILYTPGEHDEAHAYVLKVLASLPAVVFRLKNKKS
jgi:hypothetical protein